MCRIAGKKTNGLDLNPRRSFQEDMLSWFHLSKNLLLNISNDPDATEFYFDPKKGKREIFLINSFIILKNREFIKNLSVETVQDLKIKIS